MWARRESPPKMKNVNKIIKGLRKHYTTDFFAEKHDRDPFKVLISCIISLRTKDEITEKASINLLRSTWAELKPENPFFYSFMDEDLETQYRHEMRINSIVRYSTVIALLIACLGIFGLTSITTVRRSKEIGIRKVHGASVFNVVRLIAKESIIWVLIANLIAWPVAYFLMKNWLQGYAYRTSLSVLIFFAAMAIALMVAFLSVSFQAIRAATANPINSLRYE